MNRVKKINISFLFVKLTDTIPSQYALMPPCILNDGTHIEYHVVCMTTVSFMQQNLTEFNQLCCFTQEQVSNMKNVSVSIRWYPMQEVNLTVLTDLVTHLNPCLAIYFEMDLCDFNHNTQYIRSFISIPPPTNDDQYESDHWDQQLTRIQECTRASKAGVHVVITDLKSHVMYLNSQRIIELCCAVKSPSILHFDVDQFLPNIQYIKSFVYDSVDTNM